MKEKITMGDSAASQSTDSVGMLIIKMVYHAFQKKLLSSLWG